MNKDHVFKKRLLKLADLLQSLPSMRFNYARWVGSNWEGKPDLSCGTTACAFGWATTIPSLRRLGLTLKRRDATFSYVTLKSLDDNFAGAVNKAALEIFDLNDQEFDYLFIPEARMEGFPSLKLTSPTPHYTATAKEVAKHIRNFVKAKYRAKAR